MAGGRWGRAGGAADLAAREGPPGEEARLGTEAKAWEAPMLTRKNAERVLKLG